MLRLADKHSHWHGRAELLRVPKYFYGMYRKWYAVCCASRSLSLVFLGHRFLGRGLTHIIEYPNWFCGSLDRICCYRALSPSARTNLGALRYFLRYRWPTLTETPELENLSSSSRPVRPSSFKFTCTPITCSVVGDCY